MIENLAYVIFRSPNHDHWRSFAPDMLGAALAADGPDGSVRVRIDDRPWRLAIAPGERDELVALGWDVAPEHFDATIATVESAGCSVERDAATASERNAERLARFVDPFGLSHELVVGIGEGDAFEPAPHMQGSFVTGAQGMGHVVVFVPNLADATEFVTDALGLVLSDTVDAGVRLLFFHCAGTASRHHSLALAEVPGRVGVHHVMLEVSAIDDVGRAFDRVREAGHTLSMDYGRHPNDLVTSFYVRTPSGFDLEYGTGGITIDDASWEPLIYDTTSLWGHRPPPDGPPRPGILQKIATGA